MIQNVVLFDLNLLFRIKKTEIVDVGVVIWYWAKGVGGVRGGFGK